LKRHISFVPSIAVLSLIFAAIAYRRAEAQTAPTKPLTIETMYQPGGLTGRAPETTEWSPDGTKLTFV
jgi:tripartite-type tricarboxylate transporter receptor subunit TctC